MKGKSTTRGVYTPFVCRRGKPTRKTKRTKRREMSFLNKKFQAAPVHGWMELLEISKR